MLWGQAYDFNSQLATANIRQEVEDAVRDGSKDCYDAKGNLGRSRKYRGEKPRFVKR